jgi:fatty-acyl-CoA synthase
MHLKEVFNAGLRIYPDKIAVVDGKRRFTYKELGDRWNRLSNALLALGLSKGDCLCVLLKNSVEVIDANAAAVKTGALIATINYRLDSQGIEGVLNDTRCPILIVGNEFIGMIRGMRSRLPFLKTCISVGCEEEGML